MLFRSFITSLAVIAAALCLFGGAASARSHAAATPSPSATPSMPPEDPTITLIARREFVAWQAGVVDPKHYSPGTRSKLTTDKITSMSKVLGQLGALSSTEWLGPIGIQDGPPGVKAYLYRMICTNATIYEELTLAPDGLVDGIFFRDKIQ